MTKCDNCKRDIEDNKVNSLVLHYWGSKEYRLLLCLTCTNIVKTEFIDLYYQ